MSTATPSKLAFTAWLDTAAIGETFTYHTGFICRDRADEINNHTKKVVRQAVPGLDELANTVLDAEAAGKVALFQRREGIGRYAYLAVRVAGPIGYRPSLVSTRGYSVGKRIVVLPDRQAA